MKRTHVYAFMNCKEEFVGFYQVPQGDPYYITSHDPAIVKIAKLRCIKRDFVKDNPRLDPNEFYLLCEVVL